MTSRREVLDYADRHGAKPASERYGVPAGTVRPGVVVPASGPPGTGPYRPPRPSGGRLRPSGSPSGTPSGCASTVAAKGP
jgi:hypothetical protein